MRKLLIIGIGAGNPDFVTIQAIKALNRADVFFIPNKGAEKAELQQLRLEICERFIDDRDYRFVDVPMPKREAAGSDYLGVVRDWHERIEASYREALTRELDEDQCGAFLVWGDPGLYDSTIRIIDALRANGFALEYEVIPGISSIQALTASHRIPLNMIGEPVLITTGRKLAEGMPADIGTAVVMLDGEQTFARLAAEDLDIYWGAYLGAEGETIIAGKLAEVADEIAATRERLRQAHGWIMDTYLLRRPKSG
ncbi:precorrin-6A synthase (deacetylating) [Kaistia dalseonensis]|uniref:Precorrin-6A synthase [deacetylating] n=1 Tax=Kaistia dalseonensis TaxID=410840 RepID=A0ABU0H7T9_9HYPH|nr:precorrin-6A synthase (deacetylating) [Kaistia dalseonensis]MCX5494950.1 precorrin-6A synthase (deacetylating) [Kaistia dalseonensis]MDQ0437531.1 precorrin-6A synthase [Kaistia dalseonensis]